MSFCKNPFHFALLILLLTISKLSAQPPISNQQLYTQFLKQLTQQEGSTFLSYNAYARSIDSLYLTIDTLFQKRLLPQKWEIHYIHLPKKHYLRQLNLEMKIQTQDTFHFFTSTYQDTLSKQQVHYLLRKEKEDFQGKNPFWKQNYLKPVFIIASSVAIVFALFYIRSQ